MMRSLMSLLQDLKYEAPGMYQLANWKSLVFEEKQTQLFYKGHDDISVIIEFVNGAYRYRICGIGAGYHSRHFKLARTVHAKITEYVLRRQRISNTMKQGG